MLTLEHLIFTFLGRAKREGIAVPMLHAFVPKGVADKMKETKLQNSM